MKFFNFGREKKMPIGKMILLTGIIAVSSSAYGVGDRFERSSSPLERSSDSYLNDSRKPAKDEGVKETTNKERPSLPACENLNGNMECGGINPKARALKFPQPVEENITK